MSVRDIEAHLSSLYGVEIKRNTISRVTDAVLEDVAAWRTRPDAVFPIVWFDALHVKVREDRSVRTRACYLAIGATVDGELRCSAPQTISCPSGQETGGEGSPMRRSSRSRWRRR